MSTRSKAVTAGHRARRAIQATGEQLGHGWTRWRDRALASPDTSWVHHRTASVVASPWTDVRTSLDLTLADASQALAGIDHQVVTQPLDQGGWELPRIQLAPRDWDRAVAALAASPAALYLTPTGPDGRALVQQPTPVARAATVAETGAGRSALIHRMWADQSGFVAGSDLAVVLTTSQAERPEPPTEIDLVITWVDGDDPAWQARRASRQGEATGLHPTASNAARYQQQDELRVALRSVRRFAPWLRRVILVTDDQRPAWLADEFDEVEVVDHRELFDPEQLPTFNSHAIESRLHHIPGLAEHWIYGNDDIFWGNYLPPSTFFPQVGQVSVFRADEAIPDTPASPEDPPVVAAGKNTARWLRPLAPEAAALHPVRKLKHAPHPQLRSLTSELEALLPAPFEATAGSPFRAPADLSVTSSLAPHFALATGRGHQRPLTHFYADIASPELGWRLPRLIEWRDAAVICLNATDQASDRVSSGLQQLAATYSSESSSSVEADPSSS